MAYVKITSVGKQFSLITNSMNPNARRQIKDIQFRAERLINGSATLADIEEFDQYNEELKKYLIDNRRILNWLNALNKFQKCWKSPTPRLQPEEFFLLFWQCLCLA